MSDNSMPIRVAVAGAGFSGAVIAHKLAQAGFRVDVFEKRDHIGGNCFTYRDSETNVMVHQYGPHIFHTNREDVWKFVNELSVFRPYINRVKAVSQNRVYSLPVNLHTINQIYDTCLNPAEAKALIESEADHTITDPQTFEEQALRFVGPRLYKAFLYGYTRKQWGCEPSELPASILKRLPVRFNYDDNYFSHPFQGMPEEGYTPVFEVLLSHPGITLHLGETLPKDHRRCYAQTFYSGALDEYFEYQCGDLGYRSLRFEMARGDGDYQGCAVMNYCDFDIPYTRVTEHKHFAPWEAHEKTVTFTEYSFAAGRSDTPFYPVRLAADKIKLAKYMELAQQTEKVTFVGRLGTYRYLDMDQTIHEASLAADKFIACHRLGEAMPAFVISPLGGA